MVVIGIILIMSAKSGLISPQNANKIRNEIIKKPPWPNGESPRTTQRIREVFTMSKQQINHFKPEEPLQRRPRRWEVHHQIPETATSITEAVAKATKAILDPYKILELVVKSIPESLRIMGWYLALVITFMWCLIVLVIGGYSTFQALRIILGLTRYCGKGFRICIAGIYKTRKQRMDRDKSKIVKTQPI